MLLSFMTLEIAFSYVKFRCFTYLCFKYCVWMPFQKRLARRSFKNINGLCFEQEEKYISVYSTFPFIKWVKGLII